MPRTPYRGGAEVKDPVPPDVAQAFRKWARSVPGAPWRLHEQIVAVEERDETITRVATRMVRRDLHEERIAAHHRARKGAGRVNPATIDPFAESLAEIRERTEHAERCAGCGGGGVTRCLICAGSGQQRCLGCGGSGQELRHYKKSSKYVRCTACRASGTVRCGACGASGSVTCRSCAGSGEQLVWWAYKERARVVLGFAPESPILAAHRQLREERLLAPADLGAFTPFLTVETQGPIPADLLSSEDAALRAELAPDLDRQLERIVSQQFLRFGVLRRDVRYEMCGATATVVLSGADLVGAATRSAVAPIRRRLLIWGSLVLVLVFLAAWYASTLAGPTAYFAGTNRAITVVLIVGVLSGLVAVGGALSALRPGFRFWKVPTLDRMAAGVSVAAVLSSPLIAHVGRPSAEEARTAIASGDLVRAITVVDALAAGRPEAETADLKDELRLAEAERMPADARLAELDAVAARGGRHAEEAGRRAHAARLDTIRTALAADRPADALSLLERWSARLSPGDESDELRAQAFDKQVGSCRDEACTFSATRSARNAHATPERRDAAERRRATLLESLATGAPPREEPLAQAQALRALADRAAAAQAVAGDDAEVSEKARSALAWARAERAKIPLLGAAPAVVDEILERPDRLAATVGWQELEGVAVHAAVVGGQCKGLYVVGARPGARALSGQGTGLERLLAQATGSPTATLRPRPTSARTHEVSRWAEGSTTVVARWNGDTLMELRIGDAKP